VLACCSSLDLNPNSVSVVEHCIETDVLCGCGNVKTVSGLD